MADQEGPVDGSYSIDARLTDRVSCAEENGKKLPFAACIGLLLDEPLPPAARG